MNDQHEAGASTGRNVRPCRRRDKEPLESQQADEGADDVLTSIDRLDDGAPWSDIVTAVVNVGEY